MISEFESQIFKEAKIQRIRYLIINTWEDFRKILDEAWKDIGMDQSSGSKISEPYKRNRNPFVNENQLWYCINCFLNSIPTDVDYRDPLIVKISFYIKPEIRKRFFTSGTYEYETFTKGLAGGDPYIGIQMVLQTCVF